MVTQAVPRFCRLCGGELGVNEKLTGATAHARCPAADLEQPAAAQAGTPTARRYARIDGQPSAVQARNAGSAPDGPAKYKGALFASNILRLVGWIAAFLTPIIATATASSYECESQLFGQYCSNSDVTGTKIGLFVGIMVVGWLYAALMLAIGYAVLLLSDIEFNSRARQSR
jgi:hypothetical protein